MKKILLLGGDSLLLPVIKAAHDLGCYVITCDYIKGNIAHRYSDENHIVSTTDMESILNIAKNQKVDGVLTFTDSGTLTVAYVCEKLGLPSPGPYKSVQILQNKALFRAFLSSNAFNVPFAKGYTNVNEALDDIHLYKWPIIVKPVDSAGSKGVTRVDTIDTLSKSIDYALKFSISKQFIIEEFIEKDGFSSDSDCFSTNGVLTLATFSDQVFDVEAENPYTPAAYCWPSSMKIEHQLVLTAEIQRLLKLLNMKTSIYNIETRVGKNGIPYIMEVSPRGGGNRLAEMIRYATGIDMIASAVKASLGHDVEDFDPLLYNGYWAELMLHTNNEGYFEKLKIDSSIKDNQIIEINLWVKKGDLVEKFSGANKAIGTMVLKFDTKMQLVEFMKNQHNLIKVIVK